MTHPTRPAALAPRPASLATGANSLAPRPASLASHSSPLADNSKKRASAQESGTFSTSECGKCSTLTAQPSVASDNSKKRSRQEPSSRIARRLVPETIPNDAQSSHPSGSPPPLRDNSKKRGVASDPAGARA
jgi:hypothetical protein